MPNLLLEKALEYAHQGFEIVPVRSRAYHLVGQYCGKQAITTFHLHKATSDPYTIRAWWSRYPDANIGALLGGRHRLMVLDFDSYKYPHADVEVWKKRLPKTLEAKTGNGGHHLFFQVPEGIEIHPSLEALAAGIDVLTWPLVAVLPPSIHKTGGVYKWINENHPIATLPRELAEKLPTLKKTVWAGLDCNPWLYPFHDGLLFTKDVINFSYARIKYLGSSFSS